jgi:hypothetical protein
LGKSDDPANQETEARKSSLPHRAWEVAGQRKLIPEDLMAILGATNDVIRMGQHAWATLSPPSPARRSLQTVSMPQKAKPASISHLDPTSMIWTD